MEYRKVINDYKIDVKEAKGTTREENLKDITITYLYNGEYFAESIYRGVSEEKVKMIAAKLADNIGYNKKVEYQCQAIALVTIIFQVENIINH